MTNPVAFHPAAAAAPKLSLFHLLRTFFDGLESRHIRYCVLHGFDRMPESVPGDMDLAVHENDAERLPSVLRNLVDEGYFLLQHRHYAVQGNRFDFGWFEAGELVIVGLDIIFEFRYAGVILSRASQLVERRWQNDGIWFASSEDRLAYLLAKRALKGTVDSRQSKILLRLVSNIGLPVSKSIANSVFGETFGEQVIDALDQGRLDAVLPTMRSALQRRFSLWHPLNYLRYWGPEWRRRWSRWRTPTGMLMVVLGPDGCGKNTVVERIGASLREAFRNQYHFHWRPGALIPLKNTDGPEPFPHGRQRRGALLSSIYASAFQLDYWVGYLAQVYPALTRSGVVFFNRYHYDMQVDSLRYRYGGPKWLIQLFSKLLPGDPLVFVLDADPERVYQRKPELSIFELRRQRDEYRELASRLRMAFVIDANLPPDEVSRQALVIIAEHLTRRNLNNYPEWFAVASSVSQ